MRPRSLIAHHPALVLVLILFSVVTLYQSIVLPLGEADDETDHYQYLRFVARTGHPPLTDLERRQAGFKGGLAPLYYWLTFWPVTIVGKNPGPDVRRVDARPERHIPDDGLGINHVMHTLDEQWPWRGQVLAWHLVRLLSLPMAWVTIIATYALARRIVPHLKIVAVGAAVFVAFLPRFVIGSASISDDNLVFALIALLLLVQVIIVQSSQPPGVKIMAIFGALLGLSLITKYFALILVPEIVLVLWLIIRAHGTSPGAVAGPLLAFFVVLFLTAGLWFIFIVVRFNRVEELGFISGLAASLGEPQITEGLTGLLSGQAVRPVAATFALNEWLGLLYRSFWFEFGWMQVFAPGFFYALFTIFLVVVLVGLIGKIGINFLSRRPAADDRSFGYCVEATFWQLRRSSPTTRLLTLHVLLFAFVLLARYVLSATIDTGQGRHLYPALPVLALLASLGIFFVRDLTANFNLPRQLIYGVAAAIFLVPAASLLAPRVRVGPSGVTFDPAPFVLPHYRTLAASSTPILLPVAQRQSIEFDDRLWLLGLEAGTTVTAGESLPVTLYWLAEGEASRDYLLSLCLRDSEARPAACWRGQLSNGEYPARAWEAGDTVIDTIHIPIPACAEPSEQPYQLDLEIFALDPSSPVPSLLPEPLLQQTFSEPEIAIRPADRPAESVQTADLWQSGRRLTVHTELDLGQALAQISYERPADSSSPAFQSRDRPAADRWLPVSQLDTPLYLPCAEGPSPYAYLSHFIVDPTLPRGAYQPESASALPTVSLELRDRDFAPVSTTLSFDNSLSPLSVQLPNRPAVDLTEPNATGGSQATAYTVQPASTVQLPVTIRWQARRLMADPLVVSLKLLDKDFAVGGQRITRLGGRYPNVLWAPTEIVEETYPVAIRSDAVPGRYFLELSLIRQDESLPDGFEYLTLANGSNDLGPNLYPLTVRLLDPAYGSQPSQLLEASLGDHIRLTGYDVNPDFFGSPPEIELALYWQSTAKISTDYTVFTQLVDGTGQVWAQWDNPPQAGRYPTSAWATEDMLIDRYTLTMQESTPAGEYRLLVGMYDPDTGQRLPVTIAGEPQPDNAVELTTTSYAP